MENKDIKNILKICFHKGYRIKGGGNCHFKVYLPNGKMVVMSSTPSDNHAVRNIYRDFKYAGFPLE